MLRFQTEDDTQTGEKVLTCYLLPQQPPPSLGRLLPDCKGDPGAGVASGQLDPDTLSRRGSWAAEQPLGELERRPSQPCQRHQVSGGPHK